MPVLPKRGPAGSLASRMAAKQSPPALSRRRGRCVFFPEVRVGARGRFVALTATDAVHARRRQRDYGVDCPGPL
jgi:hypothetical protein